MLRGKYYFALSRFDSYGRGGEDGFLELCWAAVLGADRSFSFHYRKFEGAMEALCHGARFCDTEPCIYGQSVNF